MKNIILVTCLSLCLATHGDDLSAKQDRDDTSQYIMPVANALSNTDTNDLDNDSRTDSFLLAAWLGISGNWPTLFNCRRWNIKYYRSEPSLKNTTGLRILLYKIY